MNPSVVSRKKAVGHIVYEIMMFNEASIKLQSGVEDRFEKNILVESFVIHARNLFEFFYKNKIKDDISAYDFIFKKKEFKMKRTKKRILENLTNKANKQVVHLTYSRNNYNRLTKGWYVSIITINFNKTILAFLSCLEPREKEWFKDLYINYNVQSVG